MGQSPMMVNAAVFICSICGEASVNICSYCTKDACPNHRCERCKRCSDCCECEYPLSAEDPVGLEAVSESVPESSAPGPVSSVASFLTPEESSVFAAEDEPIDEPGLTDTGDPTEPAPGAGFA